MVNNIGVKSASAAAGAVLSYLWGGWSALLDVMLALVVVDYVSGVIASGVEGNLSSRIGMLGIAKKVFIFLVITAAHKIDVAVGNGNVIRDAVIWFFLANELLSITENMGRMGMPVPPILTQAISILKSKGGEQSASKDSE